MSFYVTDSEGNLIKYASDSTVVLGEGANPEDFYTKAQVNNITNTIKSSIPTKTSDLENDSNFITKNIDSLDNFHDKTEIENIVSEINASIPTTTSDLENDSNFITKDVARLDNFFNKDEVNSLVASINTLKFLTVTELPIENIDNNTIYLLPAIENKDKNIYNEYIFISNNWELIGTTAVDLSNYYNKLEVDNLVKIIDDEVTNSDNTWSSEKINNSFDSKGTQSISKLEDANLCIPSQEFIESLYYVGWGSNKNLPITNASCFIKTQRSNSYITQCAVPIQDDIKNTTQAYLRKGKLSDDDVTWTFTPWVKNKSDVMTFSTSDSDKYIKLTLGDSANFNSINVLDQYGGKIEILGMTYDGTYKSVKVIRHSYGSWDIDSATSYSTHSSGDPNYKIRSLYYYDTDKSYYLTVRQWAIIKIEGQVSAELVNTLPAATSDMTLIPESNWSAINDTAVNTTTSWSGSKITEELAKKQDFGVRHSLPSGDFVFEITLSDRYCDVEVIDNCGGKIMIIGNGTVNLSNNYRFIKILRLSYGSWNTHDATINTDTYTKIKESYTDGNYKCYVHVKGNANYLIKGASSVVLKNLADVDTTTLSSLTESNWGAINDNTTTTTTTWSSSKINRVKSHTTNTSMGNLGFTPKSEVSLLDFMTKLSSVLSTSYSTVLKVNWSDAESGYVVYNDKKVYINGGVLYCSQTANLTNAWADLTVLYLPNISSTSLFKFTARHGDASTATVVNMLEYPAVSSTSKISMVDYSATSSASSGSEKISSYSGYAVGNHELDTDKKFSDYHTLTFVFQCTQDGAGEYYYVTLPRAVFSASTTRNHGINCSTANTTRYMNFKYVDDTTFNIVSSSYVEMREIWGIN